MGVRVVAISGNPRPGSRTAAFAQRAAERIGGEVGAATATLVDLALAGGELDEARAELASADVAVVASPTFKATYTGLLKTVLDGLPPGALDGVVAVPLMVQAGGAHGLAADVHLRPLLLELGATTPTAAIVVSEADLVDPDALLDAWVERNAWALRATVAAAAGRRAHA
jgi:FMN reductase